jgi:hypothetical protein
MKALADLLVLKDFHHDEDTDQRGNPSEYRHEVSRKQICRNAHNHEDRHHRQKFATERSSGPAMGCRHDQT